MSLTTDVQALIYKLEEKAEEYKPLQAIADELKIILARNAQNNFIVVTNNKNRIREIREKKGITRAELARLADVPVRTLEDWENYTRRPRDVYQTTKVADALDVTLKELLGME